MLTDVKLPTAIPHNRETEEAVLGSVLINPECISVIRGIINRPDDFYIVRNKLVWEALCSLDDKKYPIDILTITQEIGEKENMLGAGYLSFLVGQCPSSLNVEHYARQTHLYGVRRRMIQAANSVARFSYNDDLEVEDVVARSIEAVQTAANGLLGGRAQDGVQLASEFYDLVERRAKEKNLPGIRTGFMDLDVLFGGGLQPSELTIIGGFPGSGKTSLMDTMAFYISKTNHVGLFTLEMSNSEQTNRLLSQETGISSQRLRSGRLEEREWPLFTHAIEDLGERKIKIDDTAPLSMSTLRAKCVQWRSQGKLDIIVIDYAGLLAGIGKTEYEVFSYLSRSLKLLAKETGCHVLAAHQFNRKGRDYEKPSIQHLRGSGTWEQDADNVLLIYEPKDITFGEFLPRNVEIAKQRNGPVGTVELQMRAATTKFESVKKVSFND